MAKIVIGCGYLGRRVARKWQSAGSEVFAVTRSASRAAEFVAEGLSPIVGDITESIDLSRLTRVETVLFAVGYDRDSGKAIRDVYVDGLRSVLDTLPDTVKCFIYISSTGVYGQTDGSWVDEDSLCDPQREGGIACLAAEQLLARHPRAAGVRILRLAGIYGPDRVPRARAVRAGEPLPTRADGILNLIHVDDAVSAVLAAEERGHPSRIYLVSDGTPVERREFYKFFAELVGAEPPRFSPTSGGTSGRGASDKRVSNRRMLAELQVELRHPDFRHGLRDIFVP